VHTQADHGDDGRLRALVDAMSDAVITIGADGKILDCNDSACRLFGYTRDEMRELERNALVDPTDPRLEGARRQRELTGHVAATLWMRTRSGERFEGLCTSVRLSSATGERTWMTVVHDTSDRARAEAALRSLQDTNERLRALTDAAFEGVLMHRDGVIQSANRAAEQLAAVGPGELVGRPLFDFIAPSAQAMVRARMAANDDRPYESIARRASGAEYPIEVQVRTLPASQGSLRVVAFRDLSERRELEAQLRHGQKMEAVGQLAGGVAHDFNNLLCVMMAATDLAIRSVPTDHEARLHLEHVAHAVERASELTVQLLAFSRKQVLHPREVDMNDVVEGAASLVRRVLPADVELVVVRAAAEARVVADPGQLELLLINLAVNARDAMSKGGTLTIEVRNTRLDGAAVRARQDLSEGAHVAIVVTDTGEGMHADTMARVFEPFFTTKALGKGTGLGLSTSFGIVKQSGGDIWVESELGRGSRFQILLPAVVREAPAKASVEGASRPASSVSADGPVVVRERAGRVVLVVEDEPLLRRVAVQVLRRAGYAVHEAASPADAKDVARSLPALDLLLTDVVMPGGSGPELARVLVEERPSLRVLFVSGYPREHGVPDATAQFLAKPFTAADLLARIAACLSSPTSGA